MATLDSEQDQNTVLRFGLQNESGKLHLANILRWDLASPGHGRTALMQLPGMTDAVADCILDWIDSDSQPREFGAENDYYQTLDRPVPANAIPQRLAELLYVKGVTRRMLFGIQNADPMATNSQQLPETAQPGLRFESRFIPGSFTRKAWLETFPDPEFGRTQPKWNPDNRGFF